MPHYPGIVKHKTGKSKYRYYYRLYKYTGNREYGGFDTARDAVEAQQIHLQRIQRQRVKPKNWTVLELCRWYIMEYDAVNNRRTTVVKTENVCRVHILPELGNIRLVDLDSIRLLQFKNKIIREKTESVAYNTMRTLRKILNKAVEEHLLPESPLVTRLPGYSSRVHEPLRPDKLIELFRNVYGRDRAIIATAVMQGRRRSEIEGLQWKDLDFDNLVMRVRRQSVDGELVDVIKNKKDRRGLTVPMTPAYAYVMKTWKLESQPSEWVFPGRDPKNPLSIESWRNKAWTRIKKENEIPDEIRLQDLRHSFASLLVGSGASMKAVQDLLGHASIVTTLNTYVHLNIGHMREALEILDSVFREENREGRNLI